MLGIDVVERAFLLSIYILDEREVVRGLRS
jgi:hypothetical protein